MQEDTGLPTPEEVQEALATDEESITAGLTQEEAAIIVKVLPRIVAKANEQAEALKAKELKKAVEALSAQNKEMVEKQLEEWRKSLTPPGPEELEKLLGQEYSEFSLKLRKNGETKDFILRELPMAAEVRIVKALKKTLGSRLKEISGLDWQTSKTTIERVQMILEMIPGAVETLAECCAVCLDPSDEDASITGEWVSNNLSMFRLASIISAQSEVGRYRDFFSLASRLMPGSMTL